MIRTGNGPLAMLARRPRLAAALALGAAWLVFFARVIFTTRVPYEGDLLYTTLPLRQYLRDRIAAGEWPEWYPYELLGAPFLGGILASPFHPQMLLLAPFTAAVATKWNLLLAYLFALAGAYRFARALNASRAASVVGAYAFGFGGYAIGLASNLAYLVPLATAPWAFVALLHLLQRERLRSAAFLAGMWALVVLGGDVQLLLELVGLAALALVFRFSWRRAGLFVLAGVLTFLLTAPEILPATVIGAESYRAEWRLTEAFGQKWALHPLRLLELVLPNMMPTEWRGDVGRLLLTGKESSFSTSFFAGGVAVALALLAVLRRRMAWLLAGIAVVFLWLALGNYGGLLPLVWKIAPGLGKLRYPEKYAGMAWVLLAPLVAMGFDELRAVPRRAAIIFGSGAIVLLALSLWSERGELVTWAFQVQGHVLPPVDPLWEVLRSDWTHGLLTSGVLLLVAVVVVLVLRKPWMVGLLVFVELGAAHLLHIPLASRAAVEAVSPLAEVVAASAREGAPANRVFPMPEGSRIPPDLSTDQRLLVTHSFLRPDDAGRAGVTPFEHNLSTETGRTLRLFYGKQPLPMATWLPRFNVCFRLIGANRSVEPPARVIDDDNGVQLVEQPCLPRAFLAAARSVETAEAAADAMHAGLPQTDVVWERGPARTASTGNVRWLEAKPEKLRLEVETAAPSALVVTDAFATGWTATVDGQPTTIYPTNVAARGVAVEAGKHVVEMLYRAPRFRLGLGLFVVGVLLTLAAALLRPRARPA